MGHRPGQFDWGGFYDWERAAPGFGYHADRQGALSATRALFRVAFYPPLLKGFFRMKSQKTLAVAAVTAATLGVLPFAVSAYHAQAAQTPAASVPDASRALVGKTAPAFSLPDQNNKTVSLGDSKGKWTVLAFYPADGTTGCTFQNKSYSAAKNKFAPLNAVAYTVSAQDTKSKQAFCSKEGLTHTLLADSGATVASEYGIAMDAGAMGKIARRVTFYIAPDGTVADVDTKINVRTAAEDSLAKLAALQAAPKTSTADGRKPLGSPGGAIRAVKSDAVFVGPSSAKVTMGAEIPDFGLPNASTGKQTGFSTLSAGKAATVIVFVSTQCPVSNAYNDRLATLATEYAPSGVQFIGVNSNSTEAAPAIAAHAKEHNWSFPVLKDANNIVADRFEAKVTPEVFVADAKGVLVYHGPVDDSQDVAGVQKRYLGDALNAITKSQPIPVKTARAFGCSIKRAK